LLENVPVRIICVDFRRMKTNAHAPSYVLHGCGLQLQPDDAAC